MRNSLQNNLKYYYERYMYVHARAKTHLCSSISHTYNQTAQRSVFRGSVLHTH